MSNSSLKKLNPRKVFWKRGGCSNAMFHIINHEYNNHKDDHEQASNLLAGGIAQKGYQCGMIWGASLAVGNEAYNRFDDKDHAIAVAINASKYIIDSFHKRTKTVNCRDIANVDFNNRWQMFFYMVKTILRGFVFSPCFNLIVKWAPEAIEAAEQGLTEKPIVAQTPCLSCAYEVIKKIGGADEDAMMVAGFAGGIGLSGNACGALAAVIWYQMLKQYRLGSVKNSEMFNNPQAQKTSRALYMQTDSEIICSKICGKTFESVDDHSNYIKEGGCAKIIEALADSFLIA